MVSLTTDDFEIVEDKPEILADFDFIANKIGKWFDTSVDLL